MKRPSTSSLAVLPALRRWLRTNTLAHGCLAVWGCEAEPEPQPQPADDAAAVAGAHAEPRCGDGRLHAEEQCDEGDANGTNGCDLSCRQIDRGNPRQPTSPASVPCGNGRLDMGEVCDEGTAGNAWLPGACAPGCQAWVNRREIRVGQPLRSGDLGEEPVAQLDASCPPGTRALFSEGVARVPPIAGIPRGRDWVLAPYTAYVRPDGVLVWTTGSERLLGVRDGVVAPLHAPLIACASGECPRALTGLSPAWVPLESDDCHGWSSDGVAVGVLGHGGARDTFLRAPGPVPCDFANTTVVAYCVEG